MAILLLISVLLYIALVAAYENLYAVVVYPHQQLCMREFLTFEPFSGKLFQIDPSVGLSYVSYHISSPTCTTHVEEIEIADPATIAQLIDLLNDFRYNYWALSGQTLSYWKRRPSVAYAAIGKTCSAI